MQASLGSSERGTAHGALPVLTRCQPSFNTSELITFIGSPAAKALIWS